MFGGGEIVSGFDSGFEPDVDLETYLDTDKNQKAEIEFTFVDSEEPVEDFQASDYQEEEDDRTLGKVAYNDAVGMYLTEMAKVPLLSQEQEVQLATRIEAGENAAEQLEQYPNHARSAEWNWLVQDGQKARTHLIEANTRLVVSIAKKYMLRGLPFLDLIQEGNLGLIKAVQKFDYHRGHRFSTYATWWIRQTITRALADQSRTIRMPVHMLDRTREMYRVTSELETQFGRKPTIEEIALKMDVEPKDVQWMTRISLKPLSLEHPAGKDDDSEMGSFIKNPNEVPVDDSAIKNQLKEKISMMLNSLQPREALILRLRYGLQNGESYTLEEVGKKFGLTRERIRQIEGQALRRLRHPSRSRHLRDYVD